MARAATIGRETTYVPQCDQESPADQQTRFFFPPASARAWALVQDSMSQVEGDQVSSRLGSGYYTAVQLLCSGWENLPDENGKLVEPQFTTVKGLRALADQSMDRIRHLIPELAAHALKVNQLTESDRGNSESPSTSTQGESKPTPPAT